MRGMKKSFFGCMYVLIFGLWGCGNDVGVVTGKSSDSFLCFAQSEIDWLQKNQPGMRKTVTRGDDVITETIDSLNWNNELEAILGWPMDEAKKKHTYDETVDSSGTLMIVRYNAQDTLANLQELMVTYRKGAIELMQWTVKQRSLWMDRDIQISFQPRMGYGVRVMENAIWKNPDNYEIYIEINNSKYLKNRL